MRIVAFVLSVALATAIAPAAVEQEPAASLLDGGRRAVSGGTAVTEVRSLVVQGRRRVLIGSTGKLSELRPLEIRILLPDRYLRITVDGPSESRYGFARGELLNSIRALKPGDSFGGTWGPEQLPIERAWFARFLLGMFSHTTAVAHLKIRSASGKSVELSGDEGFSAAVDFDAATNLPLRVRHVGDVHFPVPGSTMPPTPQKADVVWTFDDRRPVGGLRLAHRVVRSAKDITLEEMLFDKFVINQPLDAAQFGK